MAIYVFIDDVFKALAHQEDARRKRSDAEVLTTAIIAALYFGGHLDKARTFMKSTQLMPHMFDKSRFNRRLHHIGQDLTLLFLHIGHHLKKVAVYAGLFSYPCL